MHALLLNTNTVKLFLTLGVLFFCLGCNSDESGITVKSKIGNSFHFSSTHLIPKEERDDFLKGFLLSSEKVEVLENYYKLINNGEQSKANELIASDSSLANMPELNRAASFHLIKMNELDLLFKPLIQCSSLNEPHLVVLSEQLLTELDEYLNKQIEVELVIEKVAKLELNKAIIYKLKRINK